MFYYVCINKLTHFHKASRVISRSKFLIVLSSLEYLASCNFVKLCNEMPPSLSNSFPEVVLLPQLVRMPQNDFSYFCHV